MGLSDVFGSQKPDATAIDLAGSALQSPDGLAEKAEAAAAAFDAAASASASYNQRRGELLEEVDRALTGLKSNLDSARDAFTGASSDLRAAMEAAGVTRVPLVDRAPVEIKIKKGQKRNVTLKWLKTALGHDEAKSLWKKLPTYDDKTDLHMPSPYDDQPSD